MDRGEGAATDEAAESVEGVAMGVGVEEILVALGT